MNTRDEFSTLLDEVAAPNADVKTPRAEVNAPRAEVKTPAPQQLRTGYIGKSEPRPNAKRLLQGRGVFVDDLRFPRLAHVVFFRSPYAHARIKKLDFSKAARQPGITGATAGMASGINGL